MQIHLNGDARDFQDVKTIPDLVAALGLEPTMILIEHNSTALHRSDWPQTTLKENDRIEILQVAAGG
jgi:sulfur carrier protein